MSQATETFRLYKEAAQNRLMMADDVTVGVLRELTMDVYDYASNDNGDCAYVVDVSAYPALVRRMSAAHALVVVDDRNFLGWWSFETEALAREAFALYTLHWYDDDDDDIRVDLYRTGER